jgi:hypothetical protein
MGVLDMLVGAVAVFLVLWDSFETVVLSKTVKRRLSLSSLWYTATWRVWQFVVRRTRGSLRQAVLVSYGPLSLFFLIANWAALLILAFALIHYGDGTIADKSFVDYFYFSGVTFFTLGFGDLVPVSASGKVLSVAEAGTGFGLLAVVISYVPVLYGAFSRREHQITLLDSKAGSNPTAGELIRRHAEASAMQSLIQLLKEWETWSAQQLEAYLSYPVLAYYRSQHDDQSWLLSLTCILDACSLIEVGFDCDEEWCGPLRFQSQATFAMARHVIVDLAYLQEIPPDPEAPARLTDQEWHSLLAMLASAGTPLRAERADVLTERRRMYEGYVAALAGDMFYTLPAWLPHEHVLDNWQKTAWDNRRHF